MIPLRDTLPSHSTPFVTVFLIALNTLVFLYMVTLDPYSQNDFVHAYAVVPADLRYSSLLTSMFLHGGWMHLIGNMWFLWIYGDNVEDVLGHGKYVSFYLICGVIAALAQYIFSPESRVPMLGASGAVAGVMGAYLVLHATARIRMLFVILVVRVPAWLVLLYWFGLQVVAALPQLAGAQQAVESGVAVMAHVAGFLTGVVLVRAFVDWPHSRRQQGWL